MQEDTVTNENGKSKISEDLSVEISNATPKKLTDKDMPNRPLSKKKSKKGGLSMFLSGALDDTSKETPPPPPKKEGPVWGGARVAKGPTSLRGIQDEQTKIITYHPITSKKNQPEDLPMSNGHVQLSLYLPESVSSPISIMSTKSGCVPDVDKSTPPWSGNSPLTCCPSLRDIQLQQVSCNLYLFFVVFQFCG